MCDDSESSLVIMYPEDSTELDERALYLAEQLAESPFLGAEARSELVTICQFLAIRRISYQRVLEITAKTRRLTALLASTPNHGSLGPAYEDRKVIWERLQLLVRNQPVPQARVAANDSRL